MTDESFIVQGQLDPRDVDYIYEMSKNINDKLDEYISSNAAITDKHNVHAGVLMSALALFMVMNVKEEADNQFLVHASRMMKRNVVNIREMIAEEEEKNKGQNG